MAWTYTPALWSIGQKLKAATLNVGVNAISELQSRVDEFANMRPAADIDTWLSATSTQTVLGVASTVCDAKWRISQDRWVDSYVSWICPTAPAALNGTLPLPGGYTAGGPDDRALWRAPSVPGAGRLLFTNLCADTGAFAVGTTGTLKHRIATPFTSLNVVENAGNPLALRRIFAQFSYMADKP
jgi:hypothetical protein